MHSHFPSGLITFPLSFLLPMYVAVAPPGLYVELRFWEVVWLGSHSCSAVQLIFPCMQQLKVVKWPQRARTDGPCQGSSWSQSSAQWACRRQVHDNEAALLGCRVNSYHTATRLMSTFHKNLDGKMFGLLFVNDVHS